MDRSNPFKLGMPVFGDDFFGRKRQLEQVLRLLNGGSAVNIFSLRRIGKSSTLRQIAYLCKNDSQWQQYRPISIDMAMFGGEPNLETLALHVAHYLDINLRPRSGADAWLMLSDKLHN